jgi:hypothetical protein
MATSVRAGRPPLLRSLVLGAALVAAVALVGWILLLLVKGTVVLVGYVAGVALIALPLLLARRLVAGHAGPERRRRLATIAQVVALGVVLCVLAHLLGQHGWLLAAVPAAAVALARVNAAMRARRHAAVR